MSCDTDWLQVVENKQTANRSLFCLTRVNVTLQAKISSSGTSECQIVNKIKLLTVRLAWSRNIMILEHRIEKKRQTHALFNSAKKTAVFQEVKL